MQTPVQTHRHSERDLKNTYNHTESNKKTCKQPLRHTGIVIERDKKNTYNHTESDKETYKHPLRHTGILRETKTLTIIQIQTRKHANTHSDTHTY
jgi:pyruvate/2-oxoglutarate/acetoin dehydrogenase E1 component